MTDDAVLAYHTALEFHGKAYSVHERFLYLSEHAQRSIIFRGRVIRGVLVPKSVRQSERPFLGVADSERGGLRLRVTTLERTLVDILDRPDLGGGWEEIWRSLESIEFFDLDAVVDYALLLNIATTTAKVGFYLEQHKETLMVEERHLQRLRARRPQKPHYMVRGQRASGRLDAEWNLIVPHEIRERTWQEVI
jgi:predicted transcriptional regulator of viral defense system